MNRSRKIQLISVLSVVALVLLACSFQVVDPRSPADAAATQEVRVQQATANAALIEATLVATPNAACLIKGNISRSGEKIAHSPGQHNYDRTIIDPEHGEAWFCSLEEAAASGWRPAKQ